MDSAKSKIRKTVADYIQLTPLEYRAFQAQMKEVRKTLADEKFGTAKNTSMRALYEMPETLHDMLTAALELPELEWFKTLEGGRWFATTFPAFRVPESI